MTSYSQSKYWGQPSANHSKVQWNQTHSCSSQGHSFVLIRKSRKGTQLNIPETFYTEQLEKSFIETIPILAAGGCCDMEYVMYRHNSLKRQLSTKRNMCYTDRRPQYSPSFTINIGTSQPFNHGGFQQNISYSTISINPTVVSEEPCQKKEVIPLGLYCCGEPSCEHVKRPQVFQNESKEQRVLNLDETSKLVDEKGFVYVTKPPTISPLKECWKLFTCMKKQKKADTYMPTVMTKTEPKECKVCPKDSKTDSSLFRTSKDQPYALRSKLSTITESEITVSEYSSEEFVSQENRDKKEKKKYKYPQRSSYTGTGKVQKDVSLPLEKYSSLTYPSQQFCQQEGIHRWVCKPVEKKNRLFNNTNNKKYECYKE